MVARKWLGWEVVSMSGSEDMTAGRYVMTSNKSVPNAKDVLPKGLLSKLQRHCSGLVYIPAPQTQAQMNRARVRSLQIRGHDPAGIAEITGLSAKHVRDIIKRFEDGDLPVGRADYKVYETVPHEIVELVGRHVCGPIYVSPKTSHAARRRAVVQRLLQKGIPVSEVAKRAGISERRVWQIKKAESEPAQPGVAVNKSQVKAKKEKPRDRFEAGAVVEPGYVRPRLCTTCGTPINPSERDCDVCRHKAVAKRNTDGSDIVVSSFPFAILDRKF